MSSYHRGNPDLTRPIRTDAVHISARDAPRASAMPDTNPPTTLITPRPNQPPKELVLLTPPSNVHTGSDSPRGPMNVQNPATMAAPVKEPARNPARDLRGARGRPKRRRGRGGVRRPQARPTVEAAVSAHERLNAGREKERRRI